MEVGVPFHSWELWGETCGVVSVCTGPQLHSSLQSVRFRRSLNNINKSACFCNTSPAFTFVLQNWKGWKHAAEFISEFLTSYCGKMLFSFSLQPAAAVLCVAHWRLCLLKMNPNIHLNFTGHRMCLRLSELKGPKSSRWTGFIPFPLAFSSGFIGSRVTPSPRSRVFAVWSEREKTERRRCFDVWLTGLSWSCWHSPDRRASVWGSDQCFSSSFMDDYSSLTADLTSLHSSLLRLCLRLHLVFFIFYLSLVLTSALTPSKNEREFNWLNGFYIT